MLQAIKVFVACIFWLVAGYIVGSLLVISLVGCGSQADYEYQCAVKGNDCEYTDKREAGEPGPRGENGPRGRNGLKGEPGADGEDGENCTIYDRDYGAVVQCGENVVAIFDGEDAYESEWTFVGVIDPCGPEAEYDEIILVTAGGDYISYFQDGPDRFLTILAYDAAYVTTDGTSCEFGIDSEGVYYE